MSDLVERFLETDGRARENLSMDQEIEMDAENIATYARGLADILGEFDAELESKGFPEDIRHNLVIMFFGSLIADDGSANHQYPPDQGISDQE